MNPWIASLPQEVRLLASGSSKVSGSALTRSRDPIEVAQRCKAELDFFPLSFGLVGRSFEASEAKRRLISPLIPGERYTHTNQDAYLRDYEEAHFALSPKKAGWETMRTLEILSKGALPIIDLETLDPYSLAWHPVHLYQRAFEELMESFLPPRIEMVAEVMEHANQFLTSRGQIQSIFYLIGEDSAQGSALVIGPGISRPDYVEASLIDGLVSNLGTSGVSVDGVSGAYWKLSPNSNIGHGLGFGYTRFLEGGVEDLALVGSMGPETVFVTRAESYGAGIHAFLAMCCERYPDSKVVAIFGGDRRPLIDFTTLSSLPRVSVFVREPWN